MSQVRIYQPTKTAMQSGGAKFGGWVLEHEPGAAKRADPLMGWIGSGDTQEQIRLRFRTRDEAVAFSKRNGLKYSVTEPKIRRVKPKDYSANFAYNRIR